MSGGIGGKGWALFIVETASLSKTLKPDDFIILISLAKPVDKYEYLLLKYMLQDLLILYITFLLPLICFPAIISLSEQLDYLHWSLSCKNTTLSLKQ